jgi:chaperone required for assembly of F1-ATPase
VAKSFVPALQQTNPAKLSGGDFGKKFMSSKTKVYIASDKAILYSLIHLDGHHSIHLDKRAVRAPNTKAPLTIPASKPALASAIALEWDLLVSAAQALKNHLIPLTSLAARAQDIALQDAGQGITEGRPSAREDIVRVMMRYLDTDTLLCWAPVKSGFGEASGLENAVLEEEGSNSQNKNLSLRELQIRTASPVMNYLTNTVWPGVEIKPVLEETGSIMPTSQPQATKDVIRGWVSGLGAWELAGLERAVLAGKSLLVGARLVVEWSENFAAVRDKAIEEMASLAAERFTIEKAAEACSLEVSWQTGMWGEVEDTHDVEKEDLRRQLGSVVLLVSGTGRKE